VLGLVLSLQDCVITAVNIEKCMAESHFFFLLG
jgi:hypothetical protein